MHRIAIALMLFASPLAARAQAAPDAGLAHSVQQLEDRAALKQLVDTFSNLADRKDISRQVELFTPDATVESYSAGKLTSSLKGRAAIAERFGAFLSGFDTIYHINGQQTVELNGDRATGTAYTQVVLIGERDGERMRNTSGVVYNDTYVRMGGKWLIAKRTSNFTWTTVEEVPPAGA